MDLAASLSRIKSACKCLRNYGGPDRTRICDLYRVKVLPSIPYRHAFGGFIDLREPDVDSIWTPAVKQGRLDSRWTPGLPAAHPLGRPRQERLERSRVVPPRNTALGRRMTDAILVVLSFRRFWKHSVMFARSCEQAEWRANRQ